MIGIVSHPQKNILSFAFNRLRELIMLLIHGYNSRIILCWFNDYHSLIPVFLSRFFSAHSVIIVGGYDAISYQKFSHGLFAKNNFRQSIAKLSYRLCDKIWVVHKSLTDGCPFSDQSQHSILSGIKTFLPQLKTPIEEVPTGYDSNYWRPSLRPRSPIILTVGYISDERSFNIKGISLFIELARILPEFSFKIIGVSPEMAKKFIHIPDNMVLAGPMDQDLLLIEYQKSTFYFQGSLIEGLPNALCEAMLCGCIPIGRAVFGIPDAIGDTGFLIYDELNLEPVIDFVRHVDHDLSNKARARIIHQYSIDKRSQKFKDLLNLL